MKVTVNTAWAASQKLQKRQLPGRGVQKPDILNARGDAGMKVYFLKHAIQDAFSAEFERITDLLQEKQQLTKELRELNKKKEENKTGLSKKDKKRSEEIAERGGKIDSELNKIGEEEKDVTVKTGKIPVDGIKDFVDADTLEVLDFAIDFEQEKEAAEEG